MNVSELMDKIKTADVWPPVFRVDVDASDRTDGYTASVIFRSTSTANPSSLECHGETVEAALATLNLVLVERFGKCPHCGGYRNHK